MNSNHLFIIGNGFDLWHNLPTNYKDFYQQYREYLDQIEHYFPNGLQEEELWSDFENVLGKFDESILIDENPDILPLEIDYRKKTQEKLINAC